MSSIHSKGIYHGLPDLSTHNGLTAIVTGANGISGTHMLRVLCEVPERWTKIYAFSRRPPSGELPKQVEHIPLDFLSNGPKEIAGVMKEKKIKADYIFFFSYILLWKEGRPVPWGDAEFVRQNDLLFSNFLGALPLASAIPKRIFLQTGGKYYGIHLGPTDVPQEETDPRIGLELNLYYSQEDMLREFCSKHGTHWNIGIPSFILGSSRDSAQTLMFPLSVYAAVQKHLNKPLEFPSDLLAWDAAGSFSTGILNSYLFEWMVLTDNAKDQSFNASDDSAFTWGKFWPKLAKRYGISYIGPDTNEDVQFKETRTPAAPRGFGSPGLRRYKFSFVDWAKEPEVNKAWKELATKYDLRQKDLSEVDIGSVFGRADFGLQRTFNSQMSTTKAKKLGFFGFVDTNESMFSVIEELADMKIIPPL